MKFDLKIESNPASSGWVLKLSTKGQPLGEHQLNQFRVGTLVLPIPPEENRVALPANYADLWTNQNQVTALFRSILARVSQEGQIEAAGLYLFACLLGPKLWQTVQAQVPAGESLELRLLIADPDLARLPWEMIRAERQVLLGNRHVNLYRTISLASSPTVSLTVELPLRVLFVIAAKLDDPEVNAASEYLSLLRRLQEIEGFPFEIRLLSTLNGPQAATFEAMQQTIQLFQPHVLHLVAHGGLDGGRAYLEFPVENRGEDGRRDAANLEQALKGAGLRAVVLNACYSGQTPISASSNGRSNPGLGQQEELVAQTQTVRSSIAARLVEAGIPFVVGMNGRVSDQVCRLFAREFYVSLSEGHSVPEACARGRWAGLAGQYQAAQKIDWALPVLFMPENGLDRLEITGQNQVRDLPQLAREIIPPRRPDFCDRLAFLQDFQSLLIPGKSKQPALALYTVGQEGRGLGKTRLLEEMGSAAVRAGHFACVIPAEEKVDFRGYLTRTVALNIEQAAEHWFPNAPFSLRQLDLTLKALSTTPIGSNLEGLAESVKTLLKRGADDQIERRALVAAFCQDLVDLANRVGPDKLVVLLFDDTHAIGTALPYFQELLLEKGLYTVNERVRVVFAFDSTPPDRRDAAQSLFLYAQESRWINLLQVTPFLETEEALAYRQYVLHREPPLVDIGTRNELFLLFQRQVKGIPSNLMSMEKELIPFLLQIEALARANDRDLLTQ